MSYLHILAQPCSWLFLLTLLLWGHARYRGTDVARVRRWWLLTAALLYLYMTPAVAHLALGSLEWQYPLREVDGAEADAIVILSGGANRDELLPGDAELAANSIARCLAGADLARRFPELPLVVTGGWVHPDEIGPPLSTMMRALLEQLGILTERIIEEQQARTTDENATRTRQLLADDTQRVILVTDAAHMPRAARSFERAGFEVEPAPARRGALSFDWSPKSFLPSGHAAAANDAAAHEWLGLLWYWLRGNA